MTKQTALVIAPGRGTYNKEELGYFTRHHADKMDLLSQVDAYRRDKGQTCVSDLDNAERFSLKDHSRGDNASPLIYTCAYADFLSINQDKYDIVAVTGNSMGWYIALGCGAALDTHNTLDVINTMGTFMQDSLIGGQLIYTCVDENWMEIPERWAAMDALIESINARPDHDLALSIRLGGVIVFGGNESGLKALEDILDVEQGRFPFRLANHAAFHTYLQDSISEKALQHFDQGIFNKPSLPLIDGRGAIWSPYSTNTRDMFDYTFGHQVVEAYDFTKAIHVGLKEFTPEVIIVLGPGTTLGGAVAQSMISIEWDGIASKSDFIARQKSDNPIILAMGMEEQRKLAV